MGNQRDIITVDGLGASGKSALARLLAKRLGYGHLNSGLFYRAAGWLALQSGVELSQAAQVAQVISRHSIVLEKAPDGRGVVLIDGIAREDELSSGDVSRAASLVAQHPEVRAQFVEKQRSAFAPGGVVAEGRDMGTIIFPEARIKFFVEGDLSVRAQRRYEQLQGSNQQSSVEAIRSELAARDERDARREVAPMKPAPGAIVIDNSHDPLDEVVEKMFRYVAR